MIPDANAIPPITSLSNGEPAANPGPNLDNTEGITSRLTVQSHPRLNMRSIPEISHRIPSVRRCELTRLAGTPGAYAGIAPAGGADGYAAANARPQLLQNRASGTACPPHRSQYTASPPSSLWQNLLIRDTRVRCKKFRTRHLLRG